MDIKWDALGQVFVISLAVSVIVVAVFSLGALALAARQSARQSAQERGTGAGGLAAAVLCFTACAAVVLYGIYLIVPQFH
ncbi:hypothetical protein ACIHFD_21190 [Nonomuraea sp. NPDC051941]|uniref:hypothetical protein n=1 Tax=Nonomuraea sp. NPDC051941 TaxID=3364373 RepID=UPI0037C9048A